MCAGPRYLAPGPAPPAGHGILSSRCVMRLCKNTKRKTITVLPNENNRYALWPCCLPSLYFLSNNTFFLFLYMFHSSQILSFQIPLALAFRLKIIFNIFIYMYEFEYIINLNTISCWMPHHSRWIRLRRKLRLPTQFK